MPADPEGGPVGQRATEGARKANVSLLEGMTVQDHGQYRGARRDGERPLHVLKGRGGGAVLLDDDYLSTHVLFLGTIGTGKTHGMKLLLRQLRERSTADDVFVVFDTKGDFLESFRRPGDVVISNHAEGDPQVRFWNLFSDLREADEDRAGPREADERSVRRREQISEIASTVFSEVSRQAGQNQFFATAAAEVFAAGVEALLRSPGDVRLSNDLLRKELEKTADDIAELLESQPDLAGTARYLQGAGATPDSILAFLQQTLNRCFSGAFRAPEGDFSVRDFIRSRGGRALFVEYDIAAGSRLLPVYQVLLDLAIKEALGLGRRQRRGSFYFIMDEFALLPELTHLADGINFGRSLGLKFIVGSQNVSQVFDAYGPDVGQSILAGFGTVFALRLMDNASRELVRQRYGANRKQVSTVSAVRGAGVGETVVMGNVIEDWHLSLLGRGECIACLPDGGPPFFFAFDG
jgi:type IV secretory pathway TraG/TraD family ATPase VirD4